MKLGRLIAYVSLYKICCFENPTLGNDVIMVFLVSCTNLCKIWSRQERDERLETWLVDSLHSDSQNMQISNPNNMKWRHDDVIIVFSQFLCKTWSDNLQLWKFACWYPVLIFTKYCKFENNGRRNDVITMSLPKTIGKCGPPRNQSNYISFERSWQELSKYVSFIKFERFFQ